MRTKLGPPCETCWSNYEQTNCSSIWRQSSWLWTQKCGSCKDRWCNWQRYIPIGQGCSLHWVTLLGPGSARKNSQRSSSQDYDHPLTLGVRTRQWYWILGHIYMAAPNPQAIIYRYVKTKLEIAPTPQDCIPATVIFQFHDKLLSISLQWASPLAKKIFDYC